MEIPFAPVQGWSIRLNHKESYPVIAAAPEVDKGYYVRLADGREFLLPNSNYEGADARLDGFFEIDETRSPCDELQRLFHFAHNTPVIAGESFHAAEPLNCEPLQTAKGKPPYLIVLYGPAVTHSGYDLYFFDYRPCRFETYFERLFKKLLYKCRDTVGGERAADRYVKGWGSLEKTNQPITGYPSAHAALLPQATRAPVYTLAPSKK